MSNSKWIRDYHTLFRGQEIYCLKLGTVGLRVVKKDESATGYEVKISGVRNYKSRPYDSLEVAKTAAEDYVRGLLKKDLDTLGKEEGNE